ncbi:MAG: endolytic transglycosylase MltG [Thermodesulfobacteriota bacterium]
MRFSILGIIKTVVLFTLLGGVVIGGYAAFGRLPSWLGTLKAEREPAPSQVVKGREVVVTIPKGASVSQVGSILQEHGVVSSRLVFKLVAMIRGEQRKIQAGEYLVKTGSDAGDVLDLLISGKTLTITLTIPEGYNLDQVAATMEQRGIMPRSELLKRAKDPRLLKELGIEGDSLEGYLFPDTYFFRLSESKDPELVIRRMCKRFAEVYDKHVKATADKYRWTRHQVVTMASLIEKEAVAEEHRLVSAVFHNRLRKNMRLESDPTVIYGIKAMGEKITRADLQRKHPYNTYQIHGLPPGPIANPGKASLLAAIDPADVKYLFFVAKNDGTHDFSETLKEHNEKVDRYQRRPQAQSKN